MPGTKHFSRMNYHVLRGMRELLSHKKLTEEDWNEVKEFFDSCCAFCGCEDTGNTRTGIVPDHLIPAVHLGETCLGNIVPACQDCNDHRGKKDWKEYLNEVFTDDAAERIIKIEEYLLAHPYSVSEDPHEYLTNEEAQNYQEILTTWQKVWTEARNLRDKIKDRRKKDK